jgi:hypothetical protein
MRTRYGIILLTFILLAVVGVNGSSPVSAQSCAEQLGYSSLSTTQYYYNSNIAITVPVTATCSYVATQLYAVGNAYDTSSQRNLGSVRTQLTSSYGNTLTGQLVFNLSPSIIGHQLQVTVVIYGGYPYGYGYGGNGAQLAAASQLLRVNANNYQNGYNYQYGNGYNSQYWNCYQNPYCSYPGNFNGNYPGNYNGNYYTTCQRTGNTYTVQCSGYLYQPPNGCVVLAIPIENGYWFESRVYQYYSLQNLPSSYTPSWRWVTVTGQLYQGYNMASNGASCPGNYIIVNSISP